MPFCMSCGNRISDLADACPKCGTANVRKKEAPPAWESFGAPQAMYANAPAMRPLGVGEIVDAAIKLVRTHWSALFKIVAIVSVPTQILTLIFVLSMVPDLSTIPEQSTFQPGVQPVPTLPAGPSGIEFAGFLFSALLVFLATQAATAGTTKAVADAYLGEDVSWEKSLGLAMKRLGSLVWLVFLQNILISVLTMALVFPFLFVSILLGPLAIFVLPLIYAPLIYLTTAWWLAIPALLVEDVRGWQALKRSFLLVRGRWWQTFGVIILSGLVRTIIIGIALVGVIVALGSGRTSVTVGIIVFMAGNLIGEIVTTPFLGASTALMYFDLRVRKEGFDLEILAMNVGMAPTPENMRWAAAQGPMQHAAQPGAPRAATAPPVAPRMQPGRPMPTAPGAIAAQPGTPQTEGHAPPPPPPPPPRRRPVKPGYAPPPPDEQAPQDQPGPDQG
jgi:hypothetical protein